MEKFVPLQTTKSLIQRSLNEEVQSMRWNRQVQEELALLPMQQQRPPNPDRSGQILHLHEHKLQKMIRLEILKNTLAWILVMIPVWIMLFVFTWQILGHDIYFQGRKCYGSRVYIDRFGFLQNLNTKGPANTGSFFLYFLRPSSHVPGRKLRTRSQMPGASGSRVQGLVKIKIVICVSFVILCLVSGRRQPIPKCPDNPGQSWST